MSVLPAVFSFQKFQPSLYKDWLQAIEIPDFDAVEHIDVLVKKKKMIRRASLNIAGGNL